MHSLLNSCVLIFYKPNDGRKTKQIEGLTWSVFSNADESIFDVRDESSSVFSKRGGSSQERVV